MEQPNCIRFAIVGAKRVGADELRKFVGLVGVGAADRSHLVNDDGNAAPGNLPGGLGACQAAAYDMDRFHGAEARASWEEGQCRIGVVLHLAP